jgi:hypothetical protein
MSKTIHESPTITDDILFQFNTTDSNGVLTTPYKINHVTIYFIERGFSGMLREYDAVQLDPALVEELTQAKQLVIDEPTQDNINYLNDIELKIANSEIVNTQYCTQATPIKVLGYEDSTGQNFPAWLNPDMVSPPLSTAEKEKLL